MITITSNPLIINDGVGSSFLGFILLLFVISMIFLRESIHLFETNKTDLLTKVIDIIVLPSLLASGSVLVLRLLSIADLV
ncbi:MAG: hypothetical protein Phog2KO_21440 [Phototrophicaceae bacterium]